MHKTEAINVAIEYLKRNGFKHGPFNDARPFGPQDSLIWEVEFAWDGLTEHSETTDPPSILLRANLSTHEVRPVVLM